MLESRALLVRPTFSLKAESPSGHVADILDAMTGNLLGTVQRDSRESWWRGWVTALALNVYETEDEPLLFILRRRWRWSRFWNVLDADEQPIGFLRLAARLPTFLIAIDSLPGRLILDRDGQFLAEIQTQADLAEVGSILDPRGSRLADFRARAGETELAFHSATESKPLLRMLLLAVILQPLAE